MSDRPSVVRSSDRALLLGLVSEPHAGVDEAGRGPLAGPVFAAAVMLHPDRPIDGLRDSKKLSETDRERLAALIRRECLGWSVACASVSEIDRLNILQATLLAMKRAVDGLPEPPVRVLVDGNRSPDVPHPVVAVIGGDGVVPAISAASILAKSAQQAWMRYLHQQHPDYGFDRHAGYGTALHLMALERSGPSPHHRRSFRPVRMVMQQHDALDLGSDETPAPRSGRTEVPA